MFQLAAPTMAGDTSNKTGLSQAFGVASTFSYVSNLLLGILLALCFVQDQPDSSNLNGSFMWTTLMSLLELVTKLLTASSTIIQAE